MISDVKLEKLDRHWLFLSDSLQSENMTEEKAKITKSKMEKIEREMNQIQNCRKSVSLKLEIENCLGHAWNVLNRSNIANRVVKSILKN